MILGDAQIEDGLRIYAIGDIHGCFTELQALIQKIDEDLSANPVNRSRIIFLGDYVDRGPANREVIELLMELQASDRDTVFLRGNHDDKFAVFLKDPEIIGESFLKWGGVATIQGYGVEMKPGQSFSDLSAEFVKAVPNSHVGFLEQLKFWHQEGDYFFCHAGVRPGKPLDEQAEYDLMWIRADFMEHDQPFEKVVVHGHTIMDEPEVLPNRINVDTCCYGTGTLTAVVLEGNSHRFLQT